MSADFIDSNVLVYHFDDRDAAKRQTAERVVRDALETRSGCISFQVVQESMNVLTTKLSKTLAPADARRFLDDVLVPLWSVHPSVALYQRALDVQARFRYGFYDSLIIAAALAEGCTRLLSEDLQDGQRIEGLTIVNPFES
jgi:predicted nucleic acid-binding protein